MAETRSNRRVKDMEIGGGHHIWVENAREAANTTPSKFWRNLPRPQGDFPAPAPAPSGLRAIQDTQSDESMESKGRIVNRYL